MTSQSGNVLFLILIAVVLFAGLSYAVTQSSRSGSGDTSKEQQKLDQAVIDNYLTCINQGQMTLELARGCNTINYDPPSAWSGSNFNCHMFHPQGGGCAYTDLGLDSCIDSGEAQNLEIGEWCLGIVYAGESSGNRIYTTAVDLGTATWASGNTVTGSTSTTDGMANTNILVALSDAGAPYNAANRCRALGNDWYLPSREELNLLYVNKNKGALNGTFNESGSWYLSSTEQSASAVRMQRFNDGLVPSNFIKTPHRRVRCVRRD